MGDQAPRPDDRTGPGAVQPDRAAARDEAVDVQRQAAARLVGDCERRPAQPYTAAELAWRPDPNSQSERAQQWRQENAKSRGEHLTIDEKGYYTTKFGDDLSTIALRSLHDQGKQSSREELSKEMNRIVGLNVDAFPGMDKNPHLLRDGVKLRLTDCNGAKDVQLQIPPINGGRTEQPGDSRYGRYGDPDQQRTRTEPPRQGAYNRYGEPDGREGPVVRPDPRQGRQYSEAPIVRERPMPGGPQYGYADEAPIARRGYADPRYADPRYADPRYVERGDPRYMDQRYVDPRYGDPRYADQGYIDPRYRTPPFVPASYPRPDAGAAIMTGVIGLGLGALLGGRLGGHHHHRGFGVPMFESGYPMNWMGNNYNYRPAPNYNYNYSSYDTNYYPPYQQQRPVIIVNNQRPWHHRHHGWS